MRLMTTISGRALLAPDGGEGGAPSPDAAKLYPDAAAPAVVADPAPAAAPAPAADAAPAAPADAPKTALEGGTPPAEPAPELTLESYTIKLPDTFAADDPLVGSFKELALATKLPPEKAQEFVDLYAKAAQANNAAAQEQFATTQREWVKELDSDPAFTGERRTQSLAVLGTAMREYGSPEVADLLNSSGLGNNPHLARYILKLATALHEGTSVPGNKPANLPNGRQGKTPGEIMYPSMAQNARN